MSGGLAHPAIGRWAGGMELERSPCPYLWPTRLLARAADTRYRHRARPAYAALKLARLPSSAPDPKAR